MDIKIPSYIEREFGGLLLKDSSLWASRIQALRAAIENIGISSEEGADIHQQTTGGIKASDLTVDQLSDITPNLGDIDSGTAVLTSLSLTDTNTKLTEGSDNALRITTNSGWLDIGAQNTSTCHFKTDRPNFYFDKNVLINGTLYDYDNTDYYVKPSSVSYLNDVRANIYYDKGNTDYYINPAGTSVMNKIDFGVGYIDWDGTYLKIGHEGSGHVYIRAGSAGAGTIYGYGAHVYLGTSSTHGIAITGDRWYASENTSYYCDLATTSKLNALTLNGALNSWNYDIALFIDKNASWVYIKNKADNAYRGLACGTLHANAAVRSYYFQDLDNYFEISSSGSSYSYFFSTTDLYLRADEASNALLKLRMSGDWGIFAPSNANSTFLGADATAWRWCYSYGYTDKCPMFSGDALKGIKGIKATKDNKLDHSTLPDELRGKDKKGKLENNRNLSATVSYLIRAVQQLTDKIDKLEAK